jgi:hypothetical protein
MTPRPARAARTRLALAFATLVTIAGLVWMARGSRAQETDLPSVSADSVSEDFLKGPGGQTVVQGEEKDIVLPNQVHIRASKDDVVQVGEDIVIERDQQVRGHVLALGGDVTIRGIVDDDVVAMGGDVFIEDGAQVRGDAVSVGGQVTRGPGATILGSTVSVGSIPKTLFTLQAMEFVGEGVKLFSSLLTLAFVAFLSWLVVLLTARRTERVVVSIERAPLASIGWGLLALIALAPATIAVVLVAVLLVVTIIGIPVAVLAVLGYIVGLALLAVWGCIIGNTAIGGWVVRRLYPRLGEPSLLRNALVGLAAVSLPGIAGLLFMAIGSLVSPALLLAGALGGFGKLLSLGAMLAGVGGILRARAGQPAPLPGSYPSAPMPPPHATPNPPAYPGTGAPEAAPPTA